MTGRNTVAYLDEYVDLKVDSKCGWLLYGMFFNQDLITFIGNYCTDTYNLQ